MATDNFQGQQTSDLIPNSTNLQHIVGSFESYHFKPCVVDKFLFVVQYGVLLIHSLKRFYLSGVLKTFRMWQTEEDEEKSSDIFLELFSVPKNLQKLRNFTLT